MHHDKKETMETSLKIAVFWMFALYITNVAGA